VRKRERDLKRERKSLESSGFQKASGIVRMPDSPNSRKFSASARMERVLDVFVRGNKFKRRD